MASAPIAFRTNQSKYAYQGQTQLLNCYAEAQGTDAKSPVAVVPCPGMTLFASITTTACRGAIYLPDLDKAYSVHQNSVYKITYDGTSATVTRIGVIPGSDIVQISRNQADPVQISIHCEEGEFYIENDRVKIVSDPDATLEDCVSQDHAGGYTAYALRNGKWYISAINDCSDISGLDFTTAEQSAGPVRRIVADGDLFVCKSDEIEQYRNTGNADFPFELMSPVIKKGLLAGDAVVKFDNTLVFPGTDNIVYRIVGTGQVKRISDHGVERKIENDADPESIHGSAFSGEGHSFYALTGTDWTRCYDAATGFWHSRESYGLDRWRGRFPFRAWGKWLVCDELTGNLYELDKDSFVEGDLPLVWGMDSPTLQSPTGAGIIDWVRFDVAVGNGATLATAQGYDPLMMFDWSVDGGNTWKGHRQIKLGKRGEFMTKARTRRLGRFEDKGIVFRIRVSDPVIRSIVAVEVGMRPIVLNK